MLKDKRVRLKSAVAGLLVLIVLSIIWLSISAFNIHKTNLAGLWHNYPEWTIGNNERALIISPHCDDETLGCGGLIRKLVESGVKVKVVIATNGDGFYYAVARDLRDPVVLPENFVSFGYERQQESLKALKALGVSYDSVIFLGYPDRGLAEMWSYYWRRSNPYESPFTKDRNSPYINSYSRHTPYSGRAILSDLKSIISDYKPTVIYYPNPADQHSDHWAVNCFVTQALYELGMTSQVRSGLYIVHRGDWPVPQGLHSNLPLAPPGFLTDSDITWYRFALDDNSVNDKIKAIRLYKTQMPVLRRFLTSFARSNEIFSTYGPAPIRKVDHLDWGDIVPCITNPSGDGLNVDIGRNGDITSIKACYDDEFLYINVGFAHNCSKRLSYAVRIHSLPDNGGKCANIMIIKGKTKGPGQASMKGRSIKVIIPLYRLGNWKALMISADSSLGQYQVDRTSWRLLLPEFDKTDIPTSPLYQGLQIQGK